MKKKFSVVIDEYGKFNATGRVREKELFKSNLFAESVADIIKNFQLLRTSYERFMANDGLLVGQEKATINHIIEGLLASLISLRFTLSFFYMGVKVPEVENINVDYPYRIVMAGIEYHASGSFKKETFDRVQNLGQWYLELAAPQMQDLIQKIKLVAQSGSINENNVNEIIKEFDYILHLFLIMQFKLQLTSIDK